MDGWMNGWLDGWIGWKIWKWNEVKFGKRLIWKKKKKKNQWMKIKPNQKPKELNVMTMVKINHDKYIELVSTTQFWDYENKWIIVSET